MQNIESYERNLDFRLAEIKRGDPAYEVHTRAVAEAVNCALQISPPTGKSCRILVGTW